MIMMMQQAAMTSRKRRRVEIVEDIIGASQPIASNNSNNVAVDVNTVVCIQQFSHCIGLLNWFSQLAVFWLCGRHRIVQQRLGGMNLSSRSGIPSGVDVYVNFLESDNAPARCRCGGIRI
jgi:hypothetical protein